MMEEKDIQNENNTEQYNQCTNNMLDIELENACGCDSKSKINYIPNEYFYNSCQCESCDCEQYYGDNQELLCSCGQIDNPLGMDYGSCTCQCNELNLFD